MQTFMFILEHNQTSFITHWCIILFNKFMLKINFKIQEKIMIIIKEVDRKKQGLKSTLFNGTRQSNIQIFDKK